MPITVATQDAQIRRIEVQSQPRPTVCETLSQQNPSQKRTGGVAQGVGPEFKLLQLSPSSKKKKTKERSITIQDF
jgi:hypothetical protein